MDSGTSSQHDREESRLRPPSYSSLFPCSRPEPQSLDPLAAAAWHNKIYSPMHRLPDRVLIQIINMLNNSAIECIRRVARKFSPLCNEPILSRPRTPQAFCMATIPVYEPRGPGSQSCYGLWRAITTAYPGIGRRCSASCIRTGTAMAVVQPRKRLTGGKGSHGSEDHSTARYALLTILPASSHDRSV